MGVVACPRGKACRQWGWRHVPGKGAGNGGGGMPAFLKFFRTEHRVGTIPCPRNGTIPFRPPRFQNRTHPKDDVLWITLVVLARQDNLNHILYLQGLAIESCMAGQHLPYVHASKHLHPSRTYTPHQIELPAGYMKPKRTENRYIRPLA
jgi:hypothetical protein